MLGDSETLANHLKDLHTDSMLHKGWRMEGMGRETEQRWACVCVCVGGGGRGTGGGVTYGWSGAQGCVQGNGGWRVGEGDKAVCAHLRAVCDEYGGVRVHGGAYMGPDTRA